jgi:hypothetical protein
MAMPGTHVLFALEVAPALAVGDQMAYMAGSVYPDTRNTTGVAREKTHGPECPRITPGQTSLLSDFEKGWASHLYYDDEVYLEHKGLIPETCKPMGRFDDWWLYVSAIKVVEDLASCERLQALDWWKELAEIRAIDARPHSEVGEALHAYYEAVRSCYASFPTLNAYWSFFKNMQVPEPFVEKLLKNVELIKQDTEKTQKILSTRDRMVQRFF